MLEDITTSFSERYSGVTVTSTGYGNAAAYRKLCNGTADLAMVTRAPTDEETTACTDQGITLDQFALGQQALVMVVRPPPNTPPASPPIRSSSSGRIRVRTPSPTGASSANPSPTWT